MKKVLLLGALIAAGSGFGQNVGIGTATPNASAKLDVTSTNSGLLVPRVALSARNVAAPVASPATSLLVYNTNTSGTGNNAVSPGYYFWNGTLWMRFASDGEAWRIDGNAGTTGGVNYLGTSDNVSLQFRTNATQRFEIATDGRLRSFADGTAALPMYSWTSDSDIGMYRITTNTLGFSTTGAERMRIAANGNIGMGITPNANNNILTVLQTTTTGTSIYAYTSANSNWVNIEGNSASTTQGVGVRGFGYTGVEGNTSNLAGGWSGFFDWDTYIDWMFYTGSTLVSDKRLKTNIKTIDGGLSIVNSLNPVIYNKKRGAFSIERQSNGLEIDIPVTEISEYGFIAQEIEEILPELVKEKRMIVEGEAMDVKGVNYEMLIPILTKAIQEQQVQIEELKVRISELEK